MSSDVYKHNIVMRNQYAIIQSITNALRCVLRQERLLDWIGLLVHVNSVRWVGGRVGESGVRLKKKQQDKAARKSSKKKQQEKAARKSSKKRQQEKAARKSSKAKQQDKAARQSSKNRMEEEI